MPTSRIAIDTGGTFTDCVYWDGGELRTLKLFSTPRDAGAAILAALEQIAPAAKAEIRHGTTVGTNTLIERTGAKVAFVTTAGFEDTIAIGRQARPHLYRWSNPAPRPLAPDALRFGVRERVLPDGSVETALAPKDVRALFAELAAAAPEAVAVSLLFSFANPVHEHALARALEELGVPLSISHQILPEFREYERGAAVLVNAYLAPRMGSYLARLQQSVTRKYPKAKLHVMQSSGGIISAPVAAREPVRTILSGPAGGVVGAHFVAQQAGFDRILTFDMGGTSTDVALVNTKAGEPLRTTRETRVMDLPVAVPMLDIHTVGAGGGSLAGFDTGGALFVGPASAGADPGPICYGRGERPTVTDANLLLGRLDPAGLLGGKVSLDTARTRQKFVAAKGRLATVEAFADGIVRLAEVHMEKALRLISVERGFDPRDFTLVAFGGAGPLHACALASSLEMPRVLVPCSPGALSALGILMSDAVKDYSRTVMLPVNLSSSARLRSVFHELEQQGRSAMNAEGWQAKPHRSLDLRYAGQGFELEVPAGSDFVARFHRLHQQRYGYADPARAVEVVNARVRMTAGARALPAIKQRLGPGSARHARRATPQHLWHGGKSHPAAVYDREKLRPGNRLSGPAIIAEYSATTFVPPAWRARVDAWANLILEPKP